jgi:hypothetical protein
MKDTRIYVLLDFPKIEIKVYCADIEQQSGGRLYYSDNLIEINGGSSDSVIFKAGDAVELRLLSFDDKGKWHFIPVNI